MPKTTMTRRDGILKLIVEHFVKTGAPVGSKTLLETYGLGCSSATIRNEMNALENEGFLEKTHTSSGRVPSKEGYKYYVDHLRDEAVDERAKYAIAQILDERTKSVQEVIKESCEILNDLTGLASAVLGPRSDEEKLHSVQIIPLGGNTATCVFVTDKGYVENKTFVLEEGLGMDSIAKSIAIISERLKGTPVSQLPEKMEAMRPILTDYMVGQDVVYRALLSAFVQFARDRMALYGKSELLNQPEFANDAAKTRALLDFLEDPNAVRSAVEDSVEKDGLYVHIGTEEGLEDIAVISSQVNLPGEASTSLSVLGPSRMDYARVAALLRYLSAALDEYFKGGSQQPEWKKEKPAPKTAPNPKKQSSPKKAKKS